MKETQENTKDLERGSHLELEACGALRSARSSSCARPVSRSTRLLFLVTKSQSVFKLHAGHLSPPLCSLVPASARRARLLEKAAGLDLGASFESLLLLPYPAKDSTLVRSPRPQSPPRTDHSPTVSPLQNSPKPHTPTHNLPRAMSFVAPLSTPMTELFNVKHPIFLAGMNVAAGPECVHSVSSTRADC